MPDCLQHHSEKRKLRINGALLSFLAALITACAIFVPYIIYNGGIFYYYGDFNVQEIPFYQLVHDAVKSGELGWSSITDLGSDLISSYSFYLLGSPFFWLTIPFSSETVPYLIGPLLILKFSCASLTAYLYLKRYVRNRSFAVIGGLLYAFSGFSIYNVFFFHFHEPMIMFPLLLAALDSFLFDGKRGVFAVAVFAACAVNYYFFTGQVLFVLIYFFMLVFTKTYRFKIREFLLLALETLIGFSASAIILLPSVLGIIGNPRLSEYPENWSSLVYDEAQRYWLIIAGFLFPSDMPAYPTFTPDSNCKWASVAGWLPLMGITGAVAYLQLKRRDWIKKIILLLVLMAFVPVLNSAFQMFNSSIYYARWFYMAVLMLTLATVRALESRKADWNRAIRWSAGLTFGMTVLIGLMPENTYDEESGEEILSLGVAASKERFWIYALAAMISIFAFALIYKKFGTRTKKFFITATIVLCAISLITSSYIIGLGTAYSYTTETIDSSIINRRDSITVEDLDEVRSDFYACPDNTAMFWQIPSINCFQSSVSPSIMTFYESIGITRDVASRPNTDAYGLRPFLSCKYLFDYVGDNDDPDSDFVGENGRTRMTGWTLIATESNFDIYENQYYIPMGFTYTNFITEEEFDRIADLHKSEALLYAMTLSREQMEKYSYITRYDPVKYSTLYSDNPDEFVSRVDSYTYGGSSYRNACTRLAENSCSEFEYTDDGFTAKYDNTGKDANLLFFSVPYSDGFTAYVNGAEVEIENVFSGFMAVEIPADSKCDVVFLYETPGLSTGAAVTLYAAAAFALYILAVAVFKIIKKHRSKRLASPR